MPQHILTVSSEVIDVSAQEQAVRVTASIKDEVVSQTHFYVPVDQLAAAANPRTAALTYLLPAMRKGYTLRVVGQMDRLTQLNLNAWQEAMTAWRPQFLTHVAIECDWVSPELPAHAIGRFKTLQAFSAGVDSCHTLSRHSPRNEASPLSVHSGLMVHGLDIKPDNEADFAKAYARSSRILIAHDVKPLRVRTDIRQLEQQFGCDWETEAHAIFLTACLSCFEHHFDAVVFGSTFPHHDVKLPWGSNAISDPYLGSAIPYIHDGAKCNKLAKIKDIAEDITMQADMRVCFRSDDGHSNCGKCFKCLATQACYWVCGVDKPAAFANASGVKDLRRMPIKTQVNSNLLIDMARRAQAAGRSDISRALQCANGRRKFKSKSESWLGYGLRRLRYIF